MRVKRQLVMCHDQGEEETVTDVYSAEHLATQVDREALLETALRQIKERQGTIA
jgi:hypothetical protein